MPFDRVLGAVKGVATAAVFKRLPANEVAKFKSASRMTWIARTSNWLLMTVILESRRKWRYRPAAILRYRKEVI